MHCEHKGCHCAEATVELEGKKFCSEKCAESAQGERDFAQVRLRPSRLRRDLIAAPLPRHETEGETPMRPIWSGHITFGLISIPSRSTRPSRHRSTCRFDCSTARTTSPIQYKKFCSKEDKEVPNDEIVRGFEISKGEFSLVEKDELEKVEEEAAGSRR